VSGALADAGAAGPVVLRHKDANRQAALYGTFAAVALAPIVLTFAVDAPAKWWSLLLLPVVAIAGYSALRLATLKVKLDAEGVWEPDPFRLTYVTPWADVKRAERCVTSGRIAFVGVRIVHADGEKHEVEALKVQVGAAYAEPMVEEWIEAINAARDARSAGR
jgi:hypothetical protein